MPLETVFFVRAINATGSRGSKYRRRQLPRFGKLTQQPQVLINSLHDFPQLLPGDHVVRAGQRRITPTLGTLR